MEDYEKKYKESLERAMEYKNGEIERELEIGENIMEYVFPELKESNDERIRKILINYFKTCSGDYYGALKLKDIITWLEKQGKNNMGISEATKQELKDNLDKALEKETPESWNEFLDEQKLVDKVELKFHEGDWVVYNYPNTLSSISEIIQIDRDVIDLKDTNGSRFQTNINELNCNYHLWNISDVKAGDILAADPIEGIEECSFSSSFVAIYKERNGEDFDSYCFVGFDGKFCKGTTGHSTDNIHPATKEQRETLFKAMRKAGYEWDAEHKQLNKIEQKSIRSKEDIKILERIICILDSIRYYNTVDNKQEIPYQSEIDFLNSLKERYTWKPTDE